MEETKEIQEGKEELCYFLETVNYLQHMIHLVCVSVFSVHATLHMKSSSVAVMAG